jgi:S-adenosylmethionine:tRNA ribosyltransferase-isomerase
MRTADFSYDLPEELIAQEPLPERRQSRLLCVDIETGSLEDRFFVELPSLLAAGDLLVFNDTRVVPARLVGHKQSGGRVELLIERFRGANVVLAHLRASKSPRPGTELLLEQGVRARVEGREGELFVLYIEGERPVFDVLESYGHVPLPPYIRRPDVPADRERYQTVYARYPGAVAAPTAGLHFDEALLEQLVGMGIELAFVTLHVGAGTFQPVRTERIEDHRMHSEFVEVSEQVCAQIAATRARGGRVVAVGTTAVRSVETAASEGSPRPYQGETALFIVPGYKFRCVDALITNFHLPGSSLLMLVSAFGGHQTVMRAYRHAVERRYRFFSYGDAMFLHGRGRSPGAG